MRNIYLESETIHDFVYGIYLDKRSSHFLQKILSKKFEKEFKNFDNADDIFKYYGMNINNFNYFSYHFYTYFQQSNAHLQ